MICSEGVEVASAEAVDCVPHMANELGQARFVVRRYSFSCSLSLQFPRHSSNLMRPPPRIRLMRLTIRADSGRHPMGPR